MVAPRLAKGVTKIFSDVIKLIDHVHVFIFHVFEGIKARIQIVEPACCDPVSVWGVQAMPLIACEN